MYYQTGWQVITCLLQQKAQHWSVIIQNKQKLKPKPQPHILNAQVCQQVSPQMAIPGGNPLPRSSGSVPVQSMITWPLRKVFLKKNKHHILLACEPTAKTLEFIQNTEKFTPHIKKYPGKLPFRPVTHNSIGLLRELHCCRFFWF